MMFVYVATSASMPSRPIWIKSSAAASRSPARAKPRMRVLYMCRGRKPFRCRMASTNSMTSATFP
eukprot:scaffold645_cov247-Pinguiococcus_pyrenoidosus.AAC.20